MINKQWHKSEKQLTTEQYRMNLNYTSDNLHKYSDPMGRGNEEDHKAVWMSRGSEEDQEAMRPKKYKREIPTNQHIKVMSHLARQGTIFYRILF